MVEGRLADVRDRARMFRLIGDVQAGHRLPCRRAQARPVDRAELGRGNQDQHLRIGECRGCDCRRRRRGDGHDFHRQGDRAGVGARRDQAVRRNVLPGARQQSGQSRRSEADTADLGAVRQRARVERLGGAEVQGADRGGRAGDGHPSRHGAVLHDHSRSVRSGGHGRDPFARIRSAAIRRSICSTWGSRSGSWNWPSA